MDGSGRESVSVRDADRPDSGLTVRLEYVGSCQQALKAVRIQDWLARAILSFVGSHRASSHNQLTAVRGRMRVMPKSYARLYARGIPKF